MRNSNLRIPFNKFLGLAALLLAGSLLAACGMLPALSGVQPGRTPTQDCGCEVKGTRAATPTGGLHPVGPAVPAPETLTPPRPDAKSGGWETYTNAAYGFSFEYPAAYTGAEFGFCKARAAGPAPQGAQFSLNLGSRTTLTLSKASASSVQAAADAFRGDPAHKDFQFDAPVQRTVGGVPALSLPYRSGGTNRYAETTLFIKDGTLYRIDSGAPSACDIPAQNLTEMAAYAHVLDSFQFK